MADIILNKTCMVINLAKKLKFCAGLRNWMTVGVHDNLDSLLTWNVVHLSAAASSHTPPLSATTPHACSVVVMGRQWMILGHAKQLVIIHIIFIFVSFIIPASIRVINCVTLICVIELKFIKKLKKSCLVVSFTIRCKQLYRLDFKMCVQ